MRLFVALIFTFIISSSAVQANSQQLGNLLESCWNQGSLNSSALRSEVTLQFNILPSGGLQADSMKMTDDHGAEKVAARILFENARRAVIRCSARGFRVSAGTWQATFSPGENRVSTRILEPTPETPSDKDQAISLEDCVSDMQSSYESADKIQRILREALPAFRREKDRRVRANPAFKEVLSAMDAIKTDLQTGFAELEQALRDYCMRTEP